MVDLNKFSWTLTLNWVWTLDKVDLEYRLEHRIKILGLKPKILVMNLLHNLINFKTYTVKVHMEIRKLIGLIKDPT